ncbi:MAG: hypothetical protein QHI48_09525 [Bacteroidota bacterium]|nr:hypothetical protein [Bacteroidota bacterium]
MKTEHVSGKVCIGLSVEGDLLRLAAVQRVGKSLRVLDLASTAVPVLHRVPQEAGEATGTNPFEKIDLSETEEVDYTGIKDFLAAHYIPGASLAVGFGDHKIRTFLVPCDPKDSPTKILDKILSEVQHALNVELGRDRVSYERIGKSTVLSCVRVENCPLLEVFAMPLGTARRGARIDFVTANDVALVNLVRVHFRSRDNTIVHVVHVGKEETRLYILRGHDLVYIAPPVQQGANDRDYVTMLNNRLELAAENAGYPNADVVVLSGFAEEIGLKEEILANHPNVVFHSLSRLRISHGSNEALAKEIHHYPIPLSIAWEKLEPKNPHFYHINLLPHRIREEQKRLKLAWHGYLLLLLLFAATVGLTLLGLQKQEEINTLAEQLAYDRKQVEEQREIVQMITDLENRSAALVAATNTLDTLLMNAEKYSETLDTLALAAGRLQNLWVNEMKPDQDGSIAITGFSLTRPSVPSFSDAVGKTNMREISVQQIGSRKVYRFDVALTVPDMYPSSGSHAAAWHDTIRATLGDVTVRFGTADADKKVKVGAKEKKKGKKGNNTAKGDT